MGTVHRVLVVQRVVNYLLDSGDVVLILKLCVVMTENIAVLAVCLFRIISPFFVILRLKGMVLNLDLVVPQLNCGAIRFIKL